MSGPNAGAAIIGLGAGPAGAAGTAAGNGAGEASISCAGASVLASFPSAEPSGRFAVSAGAGRSLRADGASSGSTTRPDDGSSPASVVASGSAATVSSGSKLATSGSAGAPGERGGARDALTEAA